AVEAIFATCFVAAPPTLQVMPTSCLMRRLMSDATSPGEPQSLRTPLTSRKASSIDRGSTRGVMLRKMSMTCADVSRYRSKVGGTTIALGHRCRAIPSGIAERTPYLRASYEALDTTERPSR